MENEMEYQAFIKQVFDAYKCKAGEPLIQLPVRSDAGDLIAYMKPVTKDWRSTDPHLAELLTRWRQENPTISTATFKATPERTAAWLDGHIIGRDDRLLFMLNRPDGLPLGHLGYSNFDYPNHCGEIDSVLRGVKEGYAGLMVLATRTLVAWGFTELRMQDVKLSVFSDNARAVRFYERMGFQITNKRPLHKVVLHGEEKWEVAPPEYKGPIEKTYLTMTFDKDAEPAVLERKIRKLIREYKTRYHENPEKYSLPILWDGRKIGRVRPVPTVLKGDAANDAVLQTDWRNQHKDSFMVAAFTATPERTLKWLENTYFNDDLNIIFMVESVDGTAVGHTGIAGFDFTQAMAESTRLMRGAYAPLERELRVNLLELGTNEMIRWALKTLGLKKLYGRIFADNWLVYRLDTRSGFVPVDRYFIEKEGAPREMIRLELTEESFRTSPSQRELEGV